MTWEPDSSSINSAFTISRRSVVGGIGAMGAISALMALSGSRARAQPAAPVPVTSHPRLWLTGADLPRLRGWASESNPLWQEGILPLADELKAEMDTGLVPGEDDGGIAWNPYPTEHSAGFFAFMSLVHPDEAVRRDYAGRARTLLMYAINEAARGVAEGQPFRDPYFSIFDRSRWWGEAFPLTVDWIYPSLTPEDKSTIREVFLRWIEENANAQVTGEYNHPQPAGVVNDPALLADPIALRWAGNNYFTAHMRNIGLMALAFDAEDDPDGALSGNLAQATGAWLYMVDDVLRGDFRGGLTAEGFEYSQQALAYVVQFLLALHTAGQDDPAIWGPQVVLAGNPFWDEVVPAYVHSLSPVTVTIPEWEWMGPVFQPAWYGDGQSYWGPDFIGLLGALGRYDDLTGNTQRLDMIRWVQSNLPPGGAEGLIPVRVAGGAEMASTAILYFLLFDPGAVQSADFRPSLPLAHFAEGIGRLLVRTSWEDDAAWFTYTLGPNTVDHQHCDGNMFEFYRGGEWLTKERTGYGFNIGSSDYHNTVTVENDPPYHNEPDGYRNILWQRGSQWMYVATGDPAPLGLRVGEGFVHASGDATNLYNSEVEQSTDVRHVSRSIVWLQPDHIVVYDRVASKSEGRAKCFWLNFPADAVVAGNVSTMTTETGQQLAVTTLLPEDAVIAVEPAEPLVEQNEPAIGEPMQFRLRVEAPGGPLETRFLHVLQGVDAGEAADEASFVTSSEGTSFPGVVVASTAVLFQVEAGVTVETLTYAVPEGTTRHLITGLEPGDTYDVETGVIDARRVVTIRSGTTRTVDDGGMLVLELPGGA
jgi:hypothetical protein